MKKILFGFLVLSLLGLCSARAQADRAETGGLFKVFVEQADGTLVFADAVRGEDGELTVMAAGNCNGGQCTTAGGTTLSCPTSGGPSCTSAESCICHCKKLDDGTWTAVNQCVKRVVADPVDGEPIEH